WADAFEGRYPAGAARRAGDGRHPVGGSQGADRRGCGRYTGSVSPDPALAAAALQRADRLYKRDEHDVLPAAVVEEHAAHDPRPPDHRRRAGPVSVRVPGALHPALGVAAAGSEPAAQLPAELLGAAGDYRADRGHLDAG